MYVRLRVTYFSSTIKPKSDTNCLNPPPPPITTTITTTPTPTTIAITTTTTTFTSTCNRYIAGRLSDFIVTISNLSFPVNSDEMVPPDFIQCGQYVGYPAAGQTGTVTCSPGSIRGRYVFVSLPILGVLQMCEVRVFTGKFIFEKGMSVEIDRFSYKSHLNISASVFQT